MFCFNVLLILVFSEIQMEWYHVIPEWLTAIGTLFAIIIALFQKIIRDWWNKPDIIISCDDKKPYIEVLSLENDSSDDSRSIRIRVKLENKGNYIANHAALYVDSFFKKREVSEEYVKTEFTPIQMCDYKNAKPGLIAPHLLYYFDIASIRLIDDLRKQDDRGNARQFYKLAIIGDKVTQELGKGTFIIPLKFYSSRIDVKISYLKIYWNNDSFTVDKEFFGVEIVSEKDFKRIKTIDNDTPNNL